MRLRFDMRVLLVWFVVWIGAGPLGLYSGGDEERFESIYGKRVVEVYRAGGERGLREYARRYRQVLDRRNVITFLQGRGVVLSEERLEIALVLARENGNEGLLAYVYMQLGEWYRGHDDNGKCVEYWKKAIPIIERSQYPNKEATVQFLRASVGLLTNESGLEGLRKNVDQIVSNPQHSDDVFFKGIRYLLDGHFARYSGDIRKMFANYERARGCLEKSGDYELLGYIEFSIAGAYQSFDELPKALSLYDRALSYYKKAEGVEGQIQVYIEKADCYGKMGNFEELDRLLAGALSLARKNKKEFWVANIYHRLSDWWIKRKQIPKARALLNRAESIYSSRGDHPWVARVLIAKASILASEKNYAEAVAILKNVLQKLELIPGIGYGGLEYILYHDISLYYLYLGDVERSNEYLARIDSCDVDKRNLSDIGFDKLLKSDALFASGRRDEALMRAREGVSHIESYRSGLVFPSLQQGFDKDNLCLYSMAASMMFLNEEYDRAFEMLERMRARVFLDHLGEGLVPLEKGVNQELLDKKSRLLGKLSNLEKELHELDTRSHAGDAGRLKAEYQAVENELEDLDADIRLKSPVYSSIQYPYPVSVNQLQETILKEGEALVQFISYDHVPMLDSSPVMGYVISRKSAWLMPLDVSGAELSRMVLAYRRAMTRSGGGGSLECRRLAHKLYKTLFQPLEKYIGKTKNLIIVPDGKLAFVPFESLVVSRKGTGGQPVFLLDKYRIKYIQSASALGILRKQYQRNSKTNRFIGFGDPVYEYEGFSKGEVEQQTHVGGPADEVEEILRSKYDRAGGSYNRLKGTGDEVRAIAEIFEDLDNGKSVVRLREKAVEEEVKADKMKSYDYIHFACHGLLSEGFQSLVLSQDVPKRSEDGYLTLNEMMNCDFNAKLVVLSACDSGSGTLEGVEGVTGLTRAVMYAGTPAVVASLWKVDDKAAKELMVRFYENLLERKMSKVEALRQAKLWMLNNERFSSPRYWSAFVMYGE